MPISLDPRVACDGHSVSVFGDSRVLSVKKGILVSLPSCLRSHIEQFNVFELLQNTGYDVILSFLGHSRARE